MGSVPTITDLPPVCVTCGEYQADPIHSPIHPQYHKYVPKVVSSKFKPTPEQAKQLSMFAAEMAITWCRQYLIKLGDATKLNDGEVARLAEIWIAGYLSCALRLIPTDTVGDIFRVVSGADCETDSSKAASDKPL